MLNGIAPILIFSFKPSITKLLFSAIEGIPAIGDILPGIGIPIPVYLDENLTGIYVENESKTMDIDTVVQTRYDGKPPEVDQKGINSLVTVNMLASKNSTMLSVLLAMNDMIFTRVVSKDYSISYLNGTTTVFNGLLHGFSTQAGTNDDLIRATLQLSKGNSAKPSLIDQTASLKKFTGVIPVGANP